MDFFFDSLTSVLLFDSYVLNVMNQSLPQQWTSWSLEDIKGLHKPLDWTSGDLCLSFSKTFHCVKSWTSFHYSNTKIDIIHICLFKLLIPWNDMVFVAGLFYGWVHEKKGKKEVGWWHGHRHDEFINYKYVTAIYFTNTLPLMPYFCIKWQKPKI